MAVNGRRFTKKANWPLFALLLGLRFSILYRYVDAAISSASVTRYYSLDAGTVTTVTVAFTTATNIPIGGTIDIVFPTGISVAATTLSSPSGIDAGSTVPVSSNPETRTATVSVANSIMNAGSISFVLNAITN